MSKFNELFEKQGLKYFVAFFMFSYVLGTVIFNVYFYFSGIGISEFGVVQLRYVFTGMVFAMLFSVLPFSVWFLRDLWYKNIKKKKPTKRSCALFKQR
ncbi:MAG: hypothetical protein OEL89_02065, partial [Candidatus Peregrinibacteria bacterium]|nr:hypothetical protein [Candidatus Peregrinibacteria bacterium]